MNKIWSAFKSARKKDSQSVYQCRNYVIIKPYDTITHDTYAFPPRLSQKGVMPIPLVFHSNFPSPSNGFVSV